MKKVFCLALCSILFLASQGFALTGEEILKQYRANQKEIKLNDMVLVSEVDADGIKMETTIYIKGEKQRTENVIIETSNPMMGTEGQKTIVIDDGKNTTTFSPTMGVMTVPNDEDEAEEEEPMASVKFIGKEKVAGEACYKIEVQNEYDEKNTKWIATKDYVLIKEYQDSDGFVTINSDLRKINNHRMPFKTEVFDGDKLIMNSVIKSYKTDKKIPDTMFDISRVKGYKETQASQAMQNGMNRMNKMGEIMKMGMQIQKYYENGETEKAKALEKELEKMTEQMQP